MAVSIDVEQALKSANIDGSPSADMQAQAEPHWDAAVALVEKYAPEAPEAIQDGAAIRLFGFLWSQNDADTAAFPARAHNPLLVSGAAGMLSMWRNPAISTGSL